MYIVFYINLIKICYINLNFRSDQQRIGNNVSRKEDNQKENTTENNLAGAIKEQVHRCHTAIGKLCAEFMCGEIHDILRIQNKLCTICLENMAKIRFFFNILSL